MKVTVRKSDMDKFGAQTEKDSSVPPNADCRPKTPTGMITEDKIPKHASDVRRKMEGEKRISRRNQTDDTRVVSSVKSIVTRALRVRLPVKLLSTLPPSQKKSPKAQENPSTSQS